MSSPQSKARVISLMRPLKDVTVTAGETATFECELSYEGIAVEWFLGGTKLEPSDRVSPDFSTFDPPVEAAVFRTLRLGLKATGGLNGTFRQCSTEFKTTDFQLQHVVL